MSNLLAQRPRYISEKNITAALTQKVKLDNTSDPNFSIVRIEARDHLGMLYKISKVFSDLDIRIHSAKVSTQGGRGIDVFYESHQNKKILFEKLARSTKEKTISAMMVKNPEELG